MSALAFAPLQSGIPFNVSFSGTGTVPGVWLNSSETNPSLAPATEAADASPANVPASFAAEGADAITLVSGSRRQMPDNFSGPNDILASPASPAALFSVMAPLVLITLIWGGRDVVKGFRTPLKINYLEYAEARLRRLGDDAMKDVPSTVVSETVRHVRLCLDDASASIRQRADVALHRLVEIVPESAHRE